MRSVRCVGESHPCCTPAPRAQRRLTDNRLQRTAPPLNRNVVGFSLIEAPMFNEKPRARCVAQASDYSIVCINTGLISYGLPEDGVARRMVRVESKIRSYQRH